MGWSIGISIGESFAEFRASSQALSRDLRPFRRFYTPNFKIEKAVASFLSEYNMTSIDRVRVFHTWPRQALKRKLGTPAAFIGTLGFEGRPAPLLDPNLTFGVSERVDATGNVLTPLDVTALEPIVEKLKSANVQHVALGFLHANKNPIHELKAREVLESQGLKVFSGSNGSEVQRWEDAINRAYLAPLFFEREEQVRKTFSPMEPEILSLPQDFLSFDEELGAKYLPEDVNTGLYFGLEEFIVFTRNSSRHLSFQPTDVLEQSFLGAVTFKSRESGFEPGPMCWGRSVQPQILDALFMAGKLESNSEFLERVSTKARDRLDEVFSISPSGPREACEMIKTRLECELDLQSPILSMGPLARAMASLAPNVRWVLGPEDLVMDDF